MIQLSERLTAVAGLVTQEGTLADVGTDHGYIPVFLTGQKRVQRAIAMDVNAGPLKRAEEHIHQYGLENKIETRQSDGLTALKLGEADCIVIAGMGGTLMKRILTQGESVARTAKELILQPQSELQNFREFLWKSGYKITAEDMVFEDGKYYPMMRVIPGGINHSHPDLLDLKFGGKLLREKHPVLKQYLVQQKQQKEQILVNMQKNAKQDIEDRMREINQELACVNRALEQMK